MKTLSTLLVFLSVSLSSYGGIPYLIAPTNAPGTVGQQLFTAGNGYSWWDWGTNAASSNSTVVSASPSIGITTNGFNFTPFLSAAVTNWITGQDTVVSNALWNLLNASTNTDFAYARSLSLNDTNNDTVVSNALWNLLNASTNTDFAYARTIGSLATNRVDYASNALWLDITNISVVAGDSSVTVTPIKSGQNFTFSLVSTGGGGAGQATNIAAGPNIFTNLSGGLTTISWNTNATNVATLTGTNGAVIQFGGAPAGIAQQLQNSSGSVLYSIDTNGLWKTNWTLDSSGGATMQRISYGTTNGFLSTYNIIDFGANPAAANNTTAIQNALNAAGAVGGTVFVPPATNAYTYTGTLKVPANVTLLGAGTPLTGAGSYLYNSSANTLIVLSNNAVIRGLQINGGGVGSGQIGITTSLDPANPTTEYVIERNTIKNLAYGIMLSNSWTGEVHGNDISSCTVGIMLTNYANAIKIYEGHISACIVGVDVRGDVTPQINNIGIFDTIESCSNNVRLVGANWANINISCQHYSEGSTNAVYAGAGQNLNIDHTAFMQTAGSSTTNIVLRGTKEVNIDHCYFFNSVAFDADSATFGLHFDHNKWESAVTWNNQATTYSIDNNTNLFSTYPYTVAGISNTGPTYMNGTETNSTITSGFVLADNNGKRYSSTAPTNDLNTLVKTYTNESTLRVYVTNEDQTILTPTTATNTMPLFGGFWRLVISTPAAITNLTGVTAGVYTYGTLVLSNSLATTLTNYVQINAIPMGYAATNSAAVLGKNAYVIPAGKQVRLLIDCEGINQTNWAIISQ